MDLRKEENLERVWRQIGKLPNVIGFDKHGNKIRVYVSKKVPMRKIKLHASFWYKLKRRILGNRNPLLPEEFIPPTIDGIPVDVIEIGDVEAPRPIPTTTRSTIGKFRPLQAGTSAMHYKGTACTFSGLFQDKETKELYFCSNNHCFADENRASVGDPIYQPSPYDGGQLSDRIGRYHKCVPLKFESYSCFFLKLLVWFFRIFVKKGIAFNKVDVAFCSIDCETAQEKTCAILENFCAIKVYKLGLPKGIRTPRVGEQVQKVGRTTGLTFGKIVSTTWTGRINYARGEAIFTDCILIEGDFSQGGDSGSPVFDMEKNFIGILFAGSKSYSLVCKIKNIEKESGAKLVIKNTKHLL